MNDAPVILAVGVAGTGNQKQETGNSELENQPRTCPTQPNAVKFDFATATRNFPPLWAAGSPLRQALNASIGKAISSSR